MSDQINIAKHRREELRWRILRALDAGRPGAVSENLLLRIAHDVELPVTPHELRRELEWLQASDLIIVTDTHEAVWMLQLTAGGINVVDYTIECPVGIARPRKYW